MAPVVRVDEKQGSEEVLRRGWSSCGEGRQ
jgi:hypothetical protein